MRHVFQIIRQWLGGKVDKVAGKGLSTEDYTTAEKTRLSEMQTELSTLASRIGSVESPAEVWTDISFSIPVSSWTEDQTNGGYNAIIQNVAILSNSGVFAFFDDSINTYGQSSISNSVATGSVTFHTTVIPTGTISGTLRIIDSVNGTIPVSRGGTGATTASAARTTLGLGDAATENVANNLTTTSEGYLLDARQGKALNDSITNAISAMSLITPKTATSTNTEVATHDGRKFSDMRLLIFVLRDSASSSANIRNTIIIPASYWASGQTLFIYANHGANLENVSGIMFTYSSDTSVKIITVGAGGLVGCEILGIKKA